MRQRCDGYFKYYMTKKTNFGAKLNPFHIDCVDYVSYISSKYLLKMIEILLVLRLDRNLQSVLLSFFVTI